MGFEQKRSKNNILIQFANHLPTSQAPNLQCELLGVSVMEVWKSLSKSGFSVSHFFPSHEPLIILYLVLLFSGVWKCGKVTHPGKVQH